MNKRSQNTGTWAAGGRRHPLSVVRAAAALLVFAAGASLVFADTKAQTVDRMPDYAQQARKIAAKELPAAWQSTLAKPEIDELLLIPGRGVLVGLTAISWDSVRYIPSYGPYVLLDQKTGKEKWEFARDGSYNAIFTIMNLDPLIVVEELSGNGAIFFALDPESGRQVWRYQTKNEQSSFFDAGRQVLVTAERPRAAAGAKAAGPVDIDLRIVDGSTGKGLWTAVIKGTPAGDPLPSLAVVSDRLFVSGASLAAYALDTGKKAWELRGLGPTAATGSLSPTANGDILLPSASGTVYRISASGQILWKSSLDGTPGICAEQNGQLCFQEKTAGQPDAVACLASSDGHVLWRSALGGSLESGFLITEGRLVCTQRKQETHALSVEFRDLGTGKLVASTPLPPDSLRRLPDQLVAYRGRVVFANESWVGAFQTSSGQMLWEHRVRPFELTLRTLYAKEELGLQVLAEWQAAKGQNRGNKGDNIAKALQASGNSMGDYLQHSLQIRLNDPSTGIGEMKSIISAQKNLAAAQFLGSAMSVGQQIGAAMMAAREQALDQSLVQHWQAGLNMVAKLHTRLVQGDYYVRSFDRKDGSVGVLLVKLEDGSWSELRSSPSCPTEYFDTYLDFRLPVLSGDGKSLFVRGIGLDAAKWTSVKNKDRYVFAPDTVDLLPEPSILAYDLSSIAFRDAATYEPSHFYGYVYADQPERFVIPPQFDSAGSFEGGTAGVEVDGQHGIIDAAGRYILEPEFDSLGLPRKGLAAFKQDGKWGFVDSSYRIVVPPTYDKVVVPSNYDPSYFKDGRAIVELGGKYGLVDQTGRLAVPTDYDEIGGFAEGLVWVRLGQKAGYIDASGRMVVAPQFDKASDFSEGLAAVEVKDKWGYIDASGKMVIKPTFAFAYLFRDGLAEVAVSKIGLTHGLALTFGFIDKTGKTVVPLKYASAGMFSHGLAAVSDEFGHYGFVDKSGKEVIPLRFGSCTDFSADGYSHVLLNGTFYYMDTTGKLFDKKPGGEAEEKSAPPGHVLVPKTLGPESAEK